MQVFKDHFLPLDDQLTDAAWTAAKSRRFPPKNHVTLERRRLTNKPSLYPCSLS